MPTDCHKRCANRSALNPRRSVHRRHVLRIFIRAGRFVTSRIGWKGFGLLVSLTISVVAIVALVRALGNVSTAHVLDAVKTTSAMQITLSAVLVMISYASLTIYDLLALRVIGRRDIPYRVAALANFTSYPIAHGVGVVLPVCSAIRYRIYASHGLGVGDVARICFLTGLTFWLGNLTALGLSMLYAPDAISRIVPVPPIANRMIALVLLGVIAGYVLLTWRDARQLGRGRWSVTLPTGRMVFAQIGLGIVDLGAAALAMYVLMPASLDVGVARVVVVFIAATLLGFASHAPAGLGVFDATILIGLGGDHPEPLLAVLLLFRLFYHLIPFLLAVLLFGAREACRAYGRGLA